MDESRNGNFTSSAIGALMSVAANKKDFGKPAITYIAECNMERRLGRSLDNEQSAKPTSWGKLIERRVFDLLGMEYSLISKETITHPEIPYWKGSPDGVKKNTVMDIKCPISLKSFCQLVDGNDIYFARINHKEGDTYFWQLVSNAILTKSDYAELIVYCPYKSELSEIRELASNYDGDQNKVAWINWASDNEMPYLVDGGYYKNINVMKFEVKQDWKDLLTERVLEAGKLLRDYQLKPQEAKIMEKKTLLVIAPSKGEDCVFNILVAETGQHLASHFCSNERYAYNDLYYERPERIKEWTEKFGKLDVKFLDETDISKEELKKRNQQWFDNLPAEKETL